MHALLIAILVVLAPAAAIADQHGTAAGLAVRGEGYMGFSTLELGPIDEDAFQGGGAASAAVTIDQFYLQADLFGDATDYDDVESSVVGFGGHLGWRDPARAAAGVTAVYNDQEVEDLDIDVWRVGFEGEVFIDIVSLSANLGYAEVEIGNIDGDSFYFDGISVYPVEQLRLAFGGGVVDGDGGDPIGLLNAGAEYFMVNPVSVFTRWEASLLDAGPFDIDQHSLVFGVRLYWGADEPSLMAYDRAHFKESCVGFLLLGRVC